MDSHSGASSSYSHAARDKFDALLALYSRNDSLPPDVRVSFWKLGNTFDTMTDFLDTIDPRGASQLVATVSNQYSASLAVLGGYDNAWFDDFGWWTVATQRARGKACFDAEAKSELGKIMRECWSRFTGNAPYVWDRREPNSFPDCRPVFDGGVWNEYWRGTSAVYPGPKGADPTKNTLEGIQNTVTNAIYLMAAQRIGQTDPVARQAAEKELVFLFKWFDDRHHPLWWQLEPGMALVRERVGHFARRDEPIPPAPGFQTDWAWAGDQGLILGDLSDAMLHPGPISRAQLLGRATQLISGVCTHLTEAGVVQDFTRTGQVPQFDFADYETGAGVFWRNALYVWRTNRDLLSAFTDTRFQQTLRASADAAANSPIKGATIDTLTKETAVLVAASAMLSN